MMMEFSGRVFRHDALSIGETDRWIVGDIAYSYSRETGNLQLYRYNGEASKGHWDYKIDQEIYSFIQKRRLNLENSPGRRILSDFLLDILKTEPVLVDDLAEITDVSILGLF